MRSSLKTFAPAASNCFAIWKCPNRAAAHSGVQPSLCASCTRSVSSVVPSQRAICATAVARLRSSVSAANETFFVAATAAAFASFSAAISDQNMSADTGLTEPVLRVGDARPRAPPAPPPCACRVASATTGLGGFTTGRGPKLSRRGSGASAAADAPTCASRRPSSDANMLFSMRAISACVSASRALLERATSLSKPPSALAAWAAGGTGYAASAAACHSRSRAAFAAAARASRAASSSATMRVWPPELAANSGVQPLTVRSSRLAPAYNSSSHTCA